MAGLKIRRPPLPAGDEDVRELDFWRDQLYRLLSLVGTGTVNPGTINAQVVNETQTITVKGAMAGMTVHLGPPAAFTAGIMWGGYVSANDTVTVRLANPTSGNIAVASGTWTARVMP